MRAFTYYALMTCALLLTGGTAQAQALRYGTINVGAGTLPVPYGGCDRDAAALGHIGGGIGVRQGAMEIGVQVLLGTQLGESSCESPPIGGSEGVTRQRIWDVSGEHTGLHTATLNVGVIPPFARALRFNVGGGFELDAGEPVFDYGVSVRGPGTDVRLIAGVEAMQIRASYTEVQQTWKNGEIVLASESEARGSWRNSVRAYCGMEFRFGRSMRSPEPRGAR